MRCSEGYVAALVLAAGLSGCMHRIPPRYAPGTRWQGYIVTDGEVWWLADGLAEPAWDRVRWTAESPAWQEGDPRWYAAELVIEGNERRARQHGVRTRAGLWLVARTPLPLRAPYRGATWSARLVTARPARWPENWEEATAATAPGAASVPFEGPLRVGGEYVATLELQELGRDEVWRVQAMEEPDLAFGRTLIWANPELLPTGLEVGATVQARFRVESAQRQVFAVGVLYPHVEGGSSFRATQVTASLISIELK